jgi:hypothetical protein
VFGNVGVRVSTRSGTPARSADGRDAALLLPGRSAADSQRPQNANHGGKGVPVAFAQPAALSYTIACAPDDLQFANAITGAAIQTSDAPPDEAVRSVHPWSFTAEPPAADIALGPGTVALHATLNVPRGSRLVIAPGTTVQLDSGVGIDCAGALIADGTEAAPIQFGKAGGAAWGAIAVRGATIVRMQHVALRGGGPMDVGRAAFTGMLTLQNCPQVSLSHCEFEGADGPAIALLDSNAELAKSRLHDLHGDGIAVEQSILVARDSRIGFCWAAAVRAGAGAQVLLEQCELIGCRAIVAEVDGGRAELRRCRTDAEGAGTPR